ncbi:MAG: hypothetical protein N3A68_00170 [Bacteroidia bacterium]|nr:hypothetical protein [Bacteroidia bacterium]GIV23710.1 MAG: hypothetical protein KatS3mg025_1369 [Bacteroidia bacterium]
MRSAIGLLSVLLLSWGCSAERNNALSRTWHTFVSYFNGYYHAEQRFRIAQHEIERTTPDPTEGFIRIYPLIDPTYARSQYTRLEEATKKCEVIIFRHKNGKYVDDCRTLIGQCWVLRSNIPSADQNFSYVLNAFPNTPLRAKVYWWQAYASLQEENPYRAESRLTEALSLPPKQLKRHKAQLEALLAQALVAKGQPELATPFLARSVKNLDTRLRRARAYYLLGQLYLHENKPALAEAAFQKAFRLNATNGLTFQSQLQLSLLRGAKDPRLIRRLEKMAQSARYEDYKDQIYYRIGQLYAEKGQYEAALHAYKKAGSSGQSPARALAHYEVATLYFEKFQDLAAAQKHYDTAATLIPEKHPKAAEIKALQARFKEYALLKEQIHRADSLLTLAELSPEAQERVIEAYIQAEVTRRAAEKARQAQATASPGTTPPNPFLQQGMMGSRGGGFYFDNPVQVSNGRQEFARLWGDRPDEDHWRRKNKASLPTPTRTETAPKEKTADSLSIEWPDNMADLTPQRVERLKKQLLAIIPRSAAQKKAMEDTLIGAGLPLAQLYVEAFHRPDSAKALYLWLRKRLPHRSEAQVPALYGLYVLTSGTPEGEAYKQELLQKYPHSDYARLLLAGGKISQDISPTVDIHQALLESYQKEEYLTVVAFAEVTQDKWKGTPSEPAILYLIGAAYTHLGEASKALPPLRELVQKHPQAPCTPMARKLLQRLEKGQTQFVEESRPSPQLASAGPTPPISSPSSLNTTGFSTQLRSGEPILVVLLVPKDKITNETLKQHLARTHERYFGDQRLNLVVFLYNNTHHLAYVAQFSDYRSAEAYIQAIANEPWYKDLGVQYPQDFFPISQANFRVAFTQKRMHDYAAFFAQNRDQFR